MSVIYVGHCPVDMTIGHDLEEAVIQDTVTEGSSIAVMRTKLQLTSLSSLSLPRRKRYVDPLEILWQSEGNLIHCLPVFSSGGDCYGLRAAGLCAVRRECLGHCCSPMNLLAGEGMRKFQRQRAKEGRSASVDNHCMRTRNVVPRLKTLPLC
ncbi:hypothetical protein BDR05DRAFT_506783 [Suillus weaverae]|nr:hypothetical protein BDR05DRAFT_506783 [Suillus weaverae]